MNSKLFTITFSTIAVLFSSIYKIKAQDALTPSKKVVQKKWIQPKTYEMIWYALRDTAKMEMGRVTTTITVDKKHLMVISQVQLKNVKAPWIDTTIAQAGTLKPVMHSSYNMQRDMVLKFGKVVTGSYTDKQKKSTVIINDTARSNYFDSNLYPVLIGWLPLKDGYKQDVSIYDFNPAAKTGVLKAFIKNVSSGTYQSDKNGVRDVWIVTVSDEIGSNKSESLYYFDKTDRRLWKQEINSGGRKMMMKLVE